MWRPRASYGSTKRNDAEKVEDASMLTVIDEMMI